MTTSIVAPPPAAACAATYHRRMAHITYGTHTDYDDPMDTTPHEQSKVPPRGIGNLLSPPDPVVDSFSRVHSEPERATKFPPFRTLSPPVSPQQIRQPSPTPSVRHWPPQDPPLFPSAAPSETGHSQKPLFDSESRPSTAVKVSPPPATYRIALDWPRREVELYGMNGWTRRRKEETKRLQELLQTTRKHESQYLPKPSPSVANDLDDFSQSQLRKLNRSGGITKTRLLPRPVAKPKAAKNTSPTKTEPSSRSARRTPQHHALDSFDSRKTPDAQPKHKRAAPSKQKPDTDYSKWRDIEDFCPPLSSLDSAPKPLKAFWNKSPKDISMEPDYDQLDPREAEAASELRLFPQQYLAEKRRLFKAKYEAVMQQKHFNKTSAQMAMGIDVNKASKMWEMFDRVGWLDDHWFEKSK